ncbi:hypothetical protein DF947_10910 [Pedobacter paludis]|uniref:Uncharacterized protein n=1 Tax=Pedobacter paludis TaxID=2203212 RepID=A0A317EZ65_9SPHI|nr:hypothetical protein DF947_10910 [Pedobacter paludis]
MCYFKIGTAFLIDLLPLLQLQYHLNFSCLKIRLDVKKDNRGNKSKTRRIFITLTRIMFFETIKINPQYLQVE